MNVSDMISEIQDHGFDDASTVRIMSMLNRAYFDVCSREPWPFLEASITLTFDGSSDTPTNWPSGRAILSMVQTAGSSSNLTLTYMRLDDFQKQYGAVPATGNPRIYYYIGQTVHFYPTPAATDQIKMTYLKRPTALQSTDVEATVLVPYEFHGILVDGALYRLYSMEDDTDIAPTFETYFNNSIARMREQLWKNDYTRHDVIAPMSSDDLGMDVVGWPWVT